MTNIPTEQTLSEQIARAIELLDEEIDIFEACNVYDHPLLIIKQALTSEREALGKKLRVTITHKNHRHFLEEYLLTPDEIDVEGVTFEFDGYVMKITKEPPTESQEEN